nr:hypothetical protein [Helicobacter pylori]
MYLEHYSAKAFFFFLSFLKKFRIFLILAFFVSFRGKTILKRCFLRELIFFKGTYFFKETSFF